MELKLHQSLRQELRLTLNLLLKQQVELLTLPVQELERVLEEESFSNPFLKGLFKRFPSSLNFEEEVSQEPPYHPSELEELERNLRAELEGRELELALELLKYLDDRGFLSKGVKELAEELGVSEEELEKVRGKVIRLEPLGICSKDPWEFLELQIEEFYGGKEREELLRALRDAKEGREPPPPLKEKLRRLRLRPLSPQEPAFKVVKVDALVEEEGEELRVYLYEDFLELDLNEEYLELYRRSKGKVKGFLKEAFERYRTLLKAFELRRRSLRRVVEKVVQVQEDFLRGRGSLKSLTVKETAREVGLHESTVSRIVNAKFVKTPVGTYPLRVFFVRESAGGLSQEELINAIRELVEGEDKRKPLSDEAIARILRERGYPVARRTVTKYREMLGIPSSRERKLKS